MTSTGRRYLLIGRTPDAAERLWRHTAGESSGTAAELQVTFTPTGDGEVTLVTVRNDGGSWPASVDAFAAAGSPAGPSDLWFVLQHTPGPAAPPEGVFAAPEFGLHAQFLRGLLTEGVLVAAGPLPDRPGAGQTVVRTTDLATASRVLAAAQESDGAVLAGLLEVEIRPWQVLMTTVPDPEQAAG